MYAGANLGIVASGFSRETSVMHLAEFAIPGAGFVIANFLTVGAAGTIDATAEISITAKGQLLVGADLSIPNFSARLDALSSNSGITGFTPQFNKRFDAYGEVQASLALGLPAELGIGLKMPAIKIDKRIGLRNTPRLLAAAQLRATSAPNDGSPCLNGLAYDVGISNTIDYDIAGKISQLAVFKKEHIFQGCLQ
jgi:hypothetical protein